MKKEKQPTGDLSQQPLNEDSNKVVGDKQYLLSIDEFDFLDRIRSLKSSGDMIYT